jgi:hypothetical protein
MLKLILDFIINLFSKSSTNDPVIVSPEIIINPKEPPMKEPLEPIFRHEEPSSIISRNSSDAASVKLIQEWLVLNNIYTSIDGIFGPATEACVKEFQLKHHIHDNGIVSGETFDKLARTMIQASKRIHTDDLKSFNDACFKYALQHLQNNAKEIPQNRGPWVRLYCFGHDGPAYPWCAGFVTFIMEIAAKTLNISNPIKRTLSCDQLAQDAKSKNLFISGKDLDIKSLKPGDIFLKRKSKNDWVHTGFIYTVKDEYYTTIEGNSNDTGSREGIEVCSNKRAYTDDTDYIYYGI